MDEVIKLIQEKTGISEEQARGAAETVINFVKQRLPEPLASQIEGIVGGAGGAAPNPLGGLGELANLGGQSDR